MKREDIEPAEKVLFLLSEESGRVGFNTLRSRDFIKNEAQLQRIIKSLCTAGAATIKNGSVFRTSETSILIDQGGAQIIYKNELNAHRISEMQEIALSMDIEEKKRNGLQFKISIIVSILSFIVSIITLFLHIKD